jgi:D-alanyl-D-alanine carboxypeptidase (penicillin-binding protein 5/6)
MAKRQSSKLRLFASLLILGLVALYIGLCLLLPVRALRVQKPASFLNITTTQSNLPWPNYGEAAVGLIGSGTIAIHGEQTPKPIASVAKLITALAVLKKYPLTLGQQGPNITLDSTDYSIYVNYVNEQGSVVPVYTGEIMSEYQMLEAMLVPSGNNIADALARWAYGSISAYDAFANSFVKQLGMNDTTVGGDASGFSPLTTSTANDLIILAEHVMANPVLAQIVKMKSVNVPNVGIMTNYDSSILGVDNIVGIKTGNSSQAGGVFLGAAAINVNSKPVTVLTAIMGAPQLSNAISDTVPLIISLENDFSQTVLLSKGEVLGEFKQPWGGSVQITVAKDLTNYLLQGQSTKVELNLYSLKIPSRAGTIIGSVNAEANQLSPQTSEPLITVNTTTEPSNIFRLTHPWIIL